jgi:hypothetical protein
MGGGGEISQKIFPQHKHYHRREKTNRLAMATFWRTFNYDGMMVWYLAQPGEGWGCMPSPVERLHCKRPIPICRLFFKIDLLTDIAALCLTDFIDWKYIHSLVGIFDPACELLPPWTKELYLCTVAPLSSLWPPPPLPKLNVLFIQRVSVWGGKGGGELGCVDHILQEFYTLFLTRCRTYQITSQPQTKWPVKTT